MTHYLLWATKELPQETILSQIQENLPEGSEYLIFVNPPVLQSIPDVWHCHVLGRSKPRS
jgi:hypothetical protein